MAFPVSEILLLFKIGQISLSNHGLQSMVVKNLNQIELAQKFMQVEVDVACMYTNFCGHGLSGFGDIATFKIGQISLSDDGLQSMVVKNLNQIELAQKIHASRG